MQVKIFIAPIELFLNLLDEKGKLIRIATLFNVFFALDLVTCSYSSTIQVNKDYP